MGRKSAGTRARWVLGSIWNSVLRHEDGTAPLCIISFMMSRSELKQSCGTHRKTSATNPHSSAALLFLKRLIASFNSQHVHKGSSSCSGCVGAPGFPLKISSNMSAKASGGGCSVVRCIATFCSCRTLFQVPPCFNNVCSFDDFQARTSRRWSLTISKESVFRTSRLIATRRCWRRWVNMSEPLNLHLVWLHLPPMRPAWYNASSNEMIPCSIEFVCSLSSNLRNSAWNNVGWPASSRCGCQCFKPVLVGCFSCLPFSQANKQWHSRGKHQIHNVQVPCRNPQI